jgi:hypothetical protein
MGRMKRGVRIVGYRSRIDSAMLPRPYACFDGDHNNNHLVLLGIDVAAKSVDPLLSFGIEVGATPRSLVGRLLTAKRERDWRRAA